MIMNFTMFFFLVAILMKSRKNHFPNEIKIKWRSMLWKKIHLLNDNVDIPFNGNVLLEKSSVMKMASILEFLN